MKWVRTNILGRGSYGVVCLAVNPNDQLFAVKSSRISKSFSLQKEYEILQNFSDCPDIIHCLGDDLTIEDGTRYYNLMLEYASGGTLADLIKNRRGKIPEYEVRHYTRMILQGLRCIHGCGIVHCDLKPANILVFPREHGLSQLKIADFGLARVPGEEDYPLKWAYNFRGTPLYMSPESVSCGEIKAPLDIWSLGCIVVEMITGKVAWQFPDKRGLMDELIFGNGSPKIPENLSEIGKAFLKKCFARDPDERWTVDMLLRHPFVLKDHSLWFKSEDHVLLSPRSVPDVRVVEQASSSSTSLPPPGWCTFSSTSSSSTSLPPPGWCTFSSTSSSSTSLPPPGWCTFSSTSSSLNSSTSSKLGCSKESDCKFFLGLGSNSKYCIV